MPSRIVPAAFVAVAALLLVVTEHVQGEDVDKRAILETWKREVLPVVEAYSNCRIKVWDYVRLKPEDEKVSFHRSFQFCRRGDLQRLDQHRFQPGDNETEASIIGKSEAFRVFRRTKEEPFKLLKRFSGSENDDGYYNPRMFIPANFPPANSAFVIWGNPIVDFLSAPSVEFLGDEHPDPKMVELRRFLCRSQIKPDRPAVEGWFTVDESRHWVLVEHCWGVPGKRGICRMFYGEQSDVPPLQRTEVWSEKDGKPIELVQEYRVKELSFDPPDETLFTLDAFEIPVDAKAEAEQSK